MTQVEIVSGIHLKIFESISSLLKQTNYLEVIDLDVI